MADLKRGCRLVEEDEIKPAIIQLETFISKVKTDILNGDIPEKAGQHLIEEATNLINMIRC